VKRFTRLKPGAPAERDRPVQQHRRDTCAYKKTKGPSTSPTRARRLARDDSASII